MTDRRKRITVVALGAALSLLLGSGLFAIASDTVRSDGNILESGSFTPITNHDLKAARAATSSGCASATYQDGPLTALVTGGGAGGPNINLDTTAGPGQTDVVCVKNTGTQTGQIRLTFASVVQTEVGSCEATESAAGDTTCTAGAAGELKPLINVSVREQGGATGTCTGQAAHFSAFDNGTGGVPGTSVASGQFCVWQFVFAATAGTDTQKLIGQTDRMQFNILFTLEDVPA